MFELIKQLNSICHVVFDAERSVIIIKTTFLRIDDKWKETEKKTIIIIMWRKETRINHVIKQIKRNRNLDKQQQPIRFKSRRSFFISNERYDTDAIWFVAGSMLWHVIFYFWYIDIEWEPGDEWIEFKTQCYELNWNEIEKSRRSNRHIQCAFI